MACLPYLVIAILRATASLALFSLRIRQGSLLIDFKPYVEQKRSGLLLNRVYLFIHAAIVTSTSTPASILMIICLTTSVGAFRSINRLWILISNMSHVLEPSPHGVLRVVTFRVFVGNRTGPLTRRFLVFARSRSSVQTFSREATLRLVKVMRILWIFW